MKVSAEEIFGQEVPLELRLPDGTVPMVVEHPETGKDIAIPYPSRAGAHLQ